MNFAAVCWGITLVGTYRGRKHCLDEAGHLSDGDRIPHRMPGRPFESGYSARDARRPAALVKDQGHRDARGGCA